MQPWSLEAVYENLNIRDDFHPFPTYQNRETWERLKNDPRLKDSFNAVVAAARDMIGKDIPFARASVYLDFQRSGQRRAYERILGQRSAYLNTFALAECLEGKGEFLDPLMDAIWSFCEESDWCMPAHTEGLADMEKPHIDLGASNRGAEMGEILNVFGDALPEAVQKRIRYEVNRRIIEPYLTRDFSWMKRGSNWNAVCNGNVLRAALYLERDRERLAQVVQRAQNGLTFFLAGFGENGGTAEGIGYWNYGFSRYIYAAYLLDRYTEGKLDLFTPPIVKEIAQFPARIEMSVGKYPAFSDGGESNACPVGMMCLLANKLNLPPLRDFAAARMPEKFDPGSLSGLFYGFLIADLPQPDAAAFGWNEFNFLRGVQWMISRNDASNPNSLVLAAKGGRNDEPHNHNDVGNFIVHLHGESLIAELGAPVYDRDFFRDKRYTYLAARSYGHSLPVVNGFEQRAGDFSAKNVKAEHTPKKDTLQSDIVNAYPEEANLQSLIRQVSLVRGGQGKIELIDTASFRVVPQSYESALITFGNVDLPQPGIVRIQGEKAGLQIEYDSQCWNVDVEELSSAEAHLRVADRYPVVRRIAVRCKEPKMEITLKVTVVPLE